MPAQKNQILRYQVIDRCLSNRGRRYDSRGLLKEVNKALENRGIPGISKSTLHVDLNFMRSADGWEIPLEEIPDGNKKYYRYADENFSINKQPLNELEVEQLKSAISVLSRFKGLPQFNWIQTIGPKLSQALNLSEEKGAENIIIFDNNEFLLGLEYLEPLFNAILYKKVLQIKYHSFRNPEPVFKIISPYRLKEYNNRWNLIGKDAAYSLVNLPLDRIHEIIEIEGEYEESTIDFEEYFEDVIGVTVEPEQEIHQVILRVDKKVWDYIRTKRLHRSQLERNSTEEYVEISIDVISNYELQSKILQYGEGVEVLEPIELRKKIKERAKTLYEKYMEVSEDTLKVVN